MKAKSVCSVKWTWYFWKKHVEINFASARDSYMRVYKDTDSGAIWKKHVLHHSPDGYCCSFDKNNCSPHVQQRGHVNGSKEQAYCCRSLPVPGSWKSWISSAIAGRRNGDIWGSHSSARSKIYPRLSSLQYPGDILALRLLISNKQVL